MTESEIKCNYVKAAALLSTGQPAGVIISVDILHRIVYSKCDGSTESSFWKGHAAVDLANIYLVGVEGRDYVADDGKIYADTIIEADLLKAYDLCRRGIKHGCYDGVVIIAEIYYLLGDYSNAAKMYACAVKYNYKGNENAKKILCRMISEGKIDSEPAVYQEPSWDPVFEYNSPR